MDSRGFALLGLLWVLLAVGVFASVATSASKHAVHASRNRINAARAVWLAEGCAEAVRAVLGDVVANADDPQDASEWYRADRIINDSSWLRSLDCTLTMRAAGAELNVNTATPRQLTILLLAVHTPRQIIGSMVDALLDWRDADSRVRSSGAERDWYASHVRHLPRDGPLAHERELRFVRGWEQVDLDSLMDVEEARVPIGMAPFAVLLTLPGFTEETARLVRDHAKRGRRIESLLELTEQLSPASRDSLMIHFSELQRLTVLEPDAWLLESHASFGSPPIDATVELKLVRAGNRVAVVRRRTW